MEAIIFIVLSFVFSAVLCGTFYAGYLFGNNKKDKDEGLRLDETNKELVEEIAKWKSFGG